MPTLDDIPSQLTDPAPGDKLLARDISAAGSDRDKYLLLEQLALLGTAQTFTQTQTFSGRINAMASVKSGSLTLASNGVTSFAVPGGHAILLIVCLTGGATGYWGFVRCKATAGEAVCYGLVLGANASAGSDGAITGTFGAVSTMNVSTHTDGNVYINNRRGLPQIFDYVWLG